MDLERAFPDIVIAHQDAVFSMALRFLGPADAADAAQDVFVRAYRALAGYDDERRREIRMRAWLATITINVCRNRARASQRRPRTVSLDVGVDAPAAGRTVGEQVDDHETSAELAEALRKLPDPQRRAVVLHHAGGLTYAEIAAALDRPEGTVKADVHRGIQSLRTILEPRELTA